MRKREHREYGELARLLLPLVKTLWLQLVLGTKITLLVKTSNSGSCVTNREDSMIDGLQFNLN